MLIRVCAFLSGLMLCGLMFAGLVLDAPILGASVLSGLSASGAFAGDDPAAVADFQKDVLPIFAAKCIRCHGAQRRDGKLDMRSLESILAGGVSGPAVKKGNAAKSLLIELIHFNEMPPKRATPRVTKDELELLRRWIDAMPVSAVAPRSKDSGRSFRFTPLTPAWVMTAIVSSPPTTLA